MTDSALTLAPLPASRIDDLVSMWRTSFETGVGIKDPHPLQEQRAYLLREVLPNHDVRVAMQGHDIVGFVASNECWIAQLYVDVRHLRRGIGTRLLSWAKERSRGSLMLYTFARNTGARAFYEHHGFVAIAEGFEPMWQLADVKYRWVRECD